MCILIADTFTILELSSALTVVNDNIMMISCDLANTVTIPVYCRVIIQCVDCDNLCEVDSVFSGPTTVKRSLPSGHQYIVTLFAVDSNNSATEDYKITRTITVAGVQISGKYTDKSNCIE